MSSRGIVVPQADNSSVFFGLACGSDTDINVSAVVVPLPTASSLLMLRLNALSASFQFPFAVPANFSSGRVSFATSASLASDFVFDLFSGSLHCADAAFTAAAVASIATGIQPLVVPMQIETAVFALVPQTPAVETDICWSETKLVDVKSGRALAVDGSWSLFDRAKEWNATSVVLEAAGAPPQDMQRDTSAAVIAVIGSTLAVTASCSAPSCTLTWVISKHFDLDITNSSDGQVARFNPRPHHGGGKFRVRCLLHFACNDGNTLKCRCVSVFQSRRFLDLHCSWVFTAPSSRFLFAKCKISFTSRSQYFMPSQPPNFFCSQTSSILAQYALGSEATFFTFETVAKWLFSHFTVLYLDKMATLAALNNLSVASSLSPNSILTIGTVQKICEASPCDRSLVALAQKFGTGVRQLLEHNHRFLFGAVAMRFIFTAINIPYQACSYSMAAS